MCFFDRKTLQNFTRFGFFQKEVIFFDFLTVVIYFKLQKLFLQNLLTKLKNLSRINIQKEHLFAIYFHFGVFYDFRKL